MCGDVVVGKIPGMVGELRCERAIGVLRELFGAGRLEVTGQTVSVHLTAGEIRVGVLPFVRFLDGLVAPAGRRILVGLAGVPGSGKSTFVAIVQAAWRAMGLGDRLACLSIDGWHLPNEVLDRRTIRKPDGSVVPLRRRKGSPVSYDVAALAATLAEIRSSRRPVAIPVYDRRLHEPVPDADRVPPEADVVLIEGNHVLHQDDGWQTVERQLDRRAFLAIDPAACRNAIIARHERGGMSPTAARAKFAENDAPTIELVAPTVRRAELVVQQDADRRLVGVHGVAWAEVTRGPACAPRIMQTDSRPAHDESGR